MLSKQAMDVRFAALQDLCNKDVCLDNYFKNFPTTVEEKETWGMRGNGPRMTETGFNICQLSYMRESYHVNPAYALYCPHVTDVVEKMLAWPLAKIWTTYDNEYGSPLDHALKIQNAIKADIADIKTAVAADAHTVNADMHKVLFITPFSDSGCDAATAFALTAEIASTREHLKQRLDDMRKADMAVEVLEHAYRCLNVKGVDINAEQNAKRARREGY